MPIRIRGCEKNTLGSQQGPAQAVGLISPRIPGAFRRALPIVFGVLGGSA